ncbi:transcription factor A, mitochondrial-like [Sitophilus oryzae]|uniref:Transcription factor A, mitochondrial-like n=1 Tax=Sitophilus oryzae TaxID=7048 RepID=A0A6J2YK90_SITOR|nr:transcription factor A, mitochondrial-like [Sitophilus oryzae]
MTNFLKSFFLVGQFNRLCLTKRTNNVIFLPSNIGLKQGPKATLETLEIPERPKRSLTAYMQFVAERRPKLLANNPQKKLTEVVKQIAEEWREAHPEIKHKYEELARKDKENYEKRLLQYMNNLTEEQQAALKEINSKDRAASKARRIKREQRKEDKPKKPPPAYFYFVIEHAKGDNKQIRELLIKMKGEWANLTEVEKEKYNVQYAEHKKQYEKELAAWEEKMISEGKKQLVRRRTLKDNALHKKKTRKVKKSK